MTTIELSANQARELTDRIKVGVEAVWELIKQAYTSRAWSVLGYSSWDDYCTREFGTSRIKLPREERQEVVASMREIGMSTRAIASATGTSKNTITEDFKQLSQTGTPRSEPAPVKGTDGKTYTPRPAPLPAAPEPSFDDDPEPPEWEDVGTIPKSRLNDAAPPRPAPRPAPGFNPGDLDELNTPQPTAQPPKTRPEPITSRFTSAVTDLNRVLDKFHRISTDRNFPANKNQVATLHGNDLARAISELQALADHLN